MIKRISDSETLRCWAEALTASFSAAAVGIICGMLTPPVDPVMLSGLKGNFPGWLQDALRPEPAERNAVLGAVLFLPFSWVAAVAIFRRRIPPDAVVNTALAILTAAALAAVFFGSTFRDFLCCGGIAGIAALAAGIAFVYCCDRFRTIGERLPRYCYIPMLLLPVLLQIWATRIYLPEYVNFVDRGHFGLISQTVTNACNGLFAPSQYGCFAFFLLPWFAVFGHSVISISVVMGLLFLGIVTTLLFLWTRVMRNRLLILAGSCALTLITGSFTSLHLGDFDPYFQYHPIRSLEPVLAVLFVYLVLQYRRKLRWLVAAGAVLAGCGVFWNLDSGVVSFAALTIWFGWNAFCRRNREALRELIAFVLVVIAAVAILLAVCGGSETTPVFRYQEIFFLTGFYMLPLPPGLHLWPFVLGGGFGLWGWSALMVRRVPENRFWQLQFFMATLGIGLFFYYQGRSDDRNLIIVSWPFIWSMVALLDRWFRCRKLPDKPDFGGRIAGLVPIAVLGTLFGVWFADLPVTFKLCHQVATRLADRKEEYYRDFEFIRRHAPADGIANIIGAAQGFYSAQTGLMPGFQPFNQIELILKDDYRNYLDNLVASRRPLFVVARKFVYEWEPPQEFFDRFYQLQAVSPSGRIRYYLPRPQ